jgi:hypothetical protein
LAHEAKADKTNALFFQGWLAFLKAGVR